MENTGYYILGTDLLTEFSGCQVVLIGDVDQLPSVGPGAVLSELIQSNVIPVIRLDKVHRQDAGSLIALNAKRIRHGNLSLEYGSDFQLLDSPQLPESARIMEQCYLAETAKYGVDQVALLTPFRQKTETGANALNERIRDRLNPPASGKPEIVFGKRVFRLGDKVMQIRNHGEISNGDMGYITAIFNEGDDTTLRIDFGDGRVAEYDRDDLGLLELGYATSIHKAQGAEYASVIINIQCAHAIMLARPLIYTAITRAKSRVLLVGERKALCIAIKRQDTEKRGTLLAQRLQEINLQ